MHDQPIVLAVSVPSGTCRTGPDAWTASGAEPSSCLAGLGCVSRSVKLIAMAFFVGAFTFPRLAQSPLDYFQVFSPFHVGSVSFRREYDCVLRVQIVLKERRRIRGQSDALCTWRSRVSHHHSAHEPRGPVGSTPANLHRL